MEEKIGPTLHIIPEQRVYSCWSCKYFRYQMVQSGFHPIYESSCLKMNYEGTVLDDEEIKVNTTPFKINETKTPSNCPFLSSERINDKLNNLGI